MCGVLDVIEAGMRTDDVDGACVPPDVAAVQLCQHRQRTLRRALVVVLQATCSTGFSSRVSLLVSQNCTKHVNAADRTEHCVPNNTAR